MVLLIVLFRRFGSDAKTCCIRAELDHVLVTILIVGRLFIEEVSVLELFDGSGIDEVLNYVALERAREIGACPGDSTGSIPCLSNTASVCTVPVFHGKSNKCDTSGARYVDEEHAAVEMSLCDQEKRINSAEGRRAIENYMAQKGGSESKIGGENGLEGILSKFSA